MINRTKLEHILEYARQQRRFGQLCKILPGDMVEIVEIAMRKTGNYPVTPDGWISCSERMPEIRQTVIGWNGYAVRQCVYTRNEYAKTQKGREPRFETLTGIWHGVTHWMLLPEPPQEAG